MRADTTSKEFFEHKYVENVDPWEFASSEYETNRYKSILNALAPHRYERVFEPGCSIGVLTVHLASISQRVDAMDISPTAVKHARNRCKDLPNVKIWCGSLSDYIPSAEYDLVVMSEIGYYFEQKELYSLGNKLAKQIRTSGVLLAAHWLGTSADHVLSGDCVHEILGMVDGLYPEHSERHDEFRLDRWRRI